MSEPKLISPLLDGFSMGNPMSDHDGVCCCPALKEDPDKKYIIKIISVPASQVQLEALLLTGAYRDPASAMDYFKELADGVVKEAECLKNLARLEGFLPFESWQVAPMEDNRLGYQVYLVGTYKRSLERFMRRNTMTHLGAVNLGIDMCSALSAARRAGWIYADLKPSNIFISDEKEYRIGDLGFLELDSLKYTSLPSKYRSEYTAPELHDALATPNDTLDTYAVGMILYQIFNNGMLPQVEHPTEDVLPAPVNADYEIAEIILKACAPDPKDRWADPVEMGHALVAYMQRNTVNDTPIMPPLVNVEEEISAEEEEEPPKDETLPGMNDEPAAEPEELSGEMLEMLDKAKELVDHEAPAPVVVPDPKPLELLETEIPGDDEEDIPPEVIPTRENGDEVPPEMLLPEEDSEEPILPDSGNPEKPKGENFTDLDEKRKKARWKAWRVPILIVLILALLGGAGYWFYTNYYLLTIDELTVEGSKDEMTVIVSADIDETLLTVICTDTYGNTMSSGLENGQAVFTDLLPDMGYKVRVEVEGFHKLDGSTTHEYMSPARSSIVNFTAVTGNEDGSVILNFGVDGPDSDEWIVMYGTADEQAQQKIFTGHTVTVTGLTVGKEYTFQLKPNSDLYLTGDTALVCTASSIIFAEDLTVTLNAEGNLVATWAAPEGVTVESWDVHCYSGDGYDQHFTTSDLSVSFDGISTGSAYTVEVTAAGMTQPVRESITANPITITSVNVNADDVMTLQVSWEFEGPTPAEGWFLTYSIDGSETGKVVQCDTNSAVIEVRVPGAEYELTIQAVDGSTVFNNTSTCKVPNAEVYVNKDQAFYLKTQTAYFSVNMLKTPEKESWTHADVTKANYTSNFASGDNISLLLYFTQNFYLYHENITVMYVIRDAEGNVLPDLIGVEQLDWQDDMWCGKNYHYCGLNVPNAPTEAGSYSLYLYFDGYAITTVDFTVTE